MNALKSIGTKFVTATIAAGLIAGAAFAASGASVTVNLPEAVTVGSTVLPGGQYTITESYMNDGSSLMVFRSESGQTASAMAVRSADPAVDQKTAVVLQREGGTLHLDKMFIEGETTGFQFAVSK
jgi:hypothetical protein